MSNTTLDTIGITLALVAIIIASIGIIDIIGIIKEGNKRKIQTGIYYWTFLQRCKKCSTYSSVIFLNKKDYSYKQYLSVMHEKIVDVKTFHCPGCNGRTVHEIIEIEKEQV